MTTNRLSWLLVGVMSAACGCSGGGGATGPSESTQGLHSRSFKRHKHKKENAFEVERLVSDDPDLVPAEMQDPLLKNPWGLAAGPNTFWWVANNATDFSTLYDGEGMKQMLEVSIPASPTGLVFNGVGGAFPVTDGNSSGAAVFIFAGEDGTVSAWAPGVPPTMPPPSKEAHIVVPSDHDAVYKGLAIADTCHGVRLYASDFHNGKVDVFDDQWQPVKMRRHAFADRHLPPGYAPFGIRELDGKIFVTYAMQDADAHDDVKGPGFGFVDAYDTDGDFLFRVASRGHLNAPWGLAIAPDEFGRFGNRLLIGNFGDGHINAFDLKACDGFGCLRSGELREAGDGPIAIDGLWAIDFGKGNDRTGDTDALYFTAGPNDEKNGLFGYIEPAEDK
jgi:uncharacterized protein (TIGR03118 family)